MKIAILGGGGCFALGLRQFGCVLLGCGGCDAVLFVGAGEFGVPAVEVVHHGGVGPQLDLDLLHCLALLQQLLVVVLPVHDLFG